MKISTEQLEDRLENLNSQLAGLDKLNYRSAKIFRRQIRETRKELKKAQKGLERSLR